MIKREAALSVVCIRQMGVQLQALCAIAPAWGYLAHHHSDSAGLVPGIVRGHMMFPP